MSNLEPEPAEGVGGGPVMLAPAADLLPGREVVLGGVRGLPVLRTLPTAQRRMVGAWCFADHFGPHDVAGGPGMRVPPHPHTGLQTVTWLLDGAVRHRDSLGSDQLITPGQLNLMTAGHGIAHSEDSPEPPGRPPTLHGVQLWVALPGPDRSVAPRFEHHADLPRLTWPGATVTVLLGELAAVASPARAYTPILGAEVVFGGTGAVVLPLRPAFEHAAMALSGRVDVDGVVLAPGALLYLGRGRRELALAAAPGARLLLLGGVPFTEKIVMWWNFVGRDHEDIVTARAQWEAGAARFGRVAGGDPLPAPPLPTTPLLPRGRRR